MVASGRPALVIAATSSKSGFANRCRGAVCARAVSEQARSRIAETARVRFLVFMKTSLQHCLFCHQSGATATITSHPANASSKLSPGLEDLSLRQDTPSPPLPFGICALARAPASGSPGCGLNRTPDPEVPLRLAQRESFRGSSPRNLVALRKRKHTITPRSRAIKPEAAE